MNTCSVQFFVFCALLGIVIPLVRHLGVRQAILAVANLVFLASVVPTKRSAALLALCVFATYVALCLVRDRRFRGLVPATICVVLVAFLFLKRYTFIEWMLPEHVWQKVPEVIGISYMLFKFIHMLVDQSQGQLAPFTLASYVNYQLLFFTITAGPIQRYNDFYEYWTAREPAVPDARGAVNDWSRLLSGTIKVGLLAPLAWDFFERSQTRLLASSPADALEQFTIFFYSYPVFMYLNFSGYTDIVVAAARLIGLTLPENFDRPYLARNVLDFWNRWHISLTHWIRDYVFMTSYKASVTRFPKHAKGLGYGLLFFSLFLAGVWHGSTAGFAVFGVIHGLGVAINRCYADVLKGRLGREGLKRYEKNRLIHWVAVLMTVHFVCFAFIFFSSGVEGAARILGVVGHSLYSWPATSSGPQLGSFAAALSVLVPIMLVATWFRSEILAQVDRLRARVAASDWSLYSSFVVKTLFVAFMLISLWGLQKEPEIAYMRF
jgi:alginate O-acetyltransferase complex protein AlgI